MNRGVFSLALLGLLAAAPVCVRAALTDEVDNAIASATSHGIAVNGPAGLAPRPRR